MFGQLHPFVVGDFSTIAAWENDQEEKVNRFVKIMLDYPGSINVQMIEEGFEAFGIDYPNLPQYLKDKIDMIDII